MMQPDFARHLALMFCMQGVARYMDCLNFVVERNVEILPSEFVSEVRKDFADYAAKMTAAGYPFKNVDQMFQEPDDQG